MALPPFFHRGLEGLLRIFFGLILFLWTMSAAAEEPSESANTLKDLAQKTNFTGSIRGGYWSSSRTLDDRENLATTALWLKIAPKLQSNVSLFVEGWITNQQLFREYETEEQLREAYLDIILGPMDFRIGKQIIVWGKTDRINPTDNLSPRDFTLLVPEDDDQRFGTAAAKATYYFEGLSLTGLWIPHFEPDTIPIHQPTPPLSLHEEVPETSFGEWAVKIEQTGRAVDWSLSYFDGFDLFPDIGFTPPADLVLEHHRIQVIGADAATTLGRYGLRGEAAYTMTQDSKGDNPFIKNPFFFMVIGGDRTFIEYLNVNLQYLLRVVVNYQNPEATGNPVAIEQAVVNNQLDQIQQGVTARVNYKWLNETLEGEIAGVLFFPRHDYLIRPKVTYAFTDHWKGTIGGDLYRGEQRSFFGYLRDNSTAYAELRWSF
jgi:hypothetical protein